MNIRIFRNIIRGISAHLFLCCILVVLFAACSRTQFAIIETSVVPVVHVSSVSDAVAVSSGGLGILVEVEVEPGQSPEFMAIVGSPNKIYSWEMALHRLDIKDQHVYGTFDLCMPASIPLPTGRWSLQLVHEDGRLIESWFEINRYHEVSDKLGEIASTVPKFTIIAQSDGSTSISLEDSLLASGKWDVSVLDGTGIPLGSQVIVDGKFTKQEALNFGSASRPVSIIRSRQVNEQFGVLVINNVNVTQGGQLL